MANRREFLNQLQDQLSSWTDWVRQLDDQALASAENVREDAKALYEQRAIQVRDLIQQGRGHLERFAEASDDAWDGVSSGAEQAWAALKDAAASLAAQPSPAAYEPTVQAVAPKAKVAAKPRAAAKRRPVAKPKAKAKAKAKPAAKKQGASAKKKSVKAARSKAKSGSPAKAKRGAPKRKAVAKRKTVAKSARSAKRKPARKK